MRSRRLGRSGASGWRRRAGARRHGPLVRVARRAARWRASGRSRRRARSTARTCSITPRGRGWLRGESADGHVSGRPGTAIAVTVADCVPVFIAHPSGAIALLHSGWRGTAARSSSGIGGVDGSGLSAGELLMHTGRRSAATATRSAPTSTRSSPEGIRAGRRRSICARSSPNTRAPWCPTHHHERVMYAVRQHQFFSHRAGDDGRQLGVMIGEPS